METDTAARREAHAGPRDDPGPPPVRQTRTRDALRTVLGGVVCLALVFLPIEAVRAGMPDVHGFIRPVLYMAAFVVLAGVVALLGPLPRGSRWWWLRVMAVAALVLLAGGVVPQRRINRAAAAPRVWPSQPVEEVGMGLVTRWEGRAPVYVVGVLCPGEADCMAGRTVHVALRLPGRALGVSLPPDRLVRLRRGEYRARIHGPPDAQVRRADYLAARGWEGWITRESASADTLTGSR